MSWKLKNSENDELTIPVFVYGSLLDGLSNHGVLNTEDSDFGGMFVTCDRYIMVSLGMFPGIICQTNLSNPLYNTHAKNIRPVLGELYWVTQSMLDTLDQLEGHPSFYERKAVQVKPWRKHDIVSEQSCIDLDLNTAPLGYGRAWVYELPSAYLTTGADLVEPLYGYNLPGVLSWAKAVANENPPRAESI